MTASAGQAVTVKPMNELLSVEVIKKLQGHAAKLVHCQCIGCGESEFLSMETCGILTPFSNGNG